MRRCQFCAADAMAVDDLVTFGPRSSAGIVLTWFGREYSIPHTGRVNSSPPSATYMRQWAGSALVRVMAWRRTGAKPLPEPMLAYCELDSWEQISVKIESEFYRFHSRKCIWNCRLPKVAAILFRGRWVKRVWCQPSFKLRFGAFMVLESYLRPILQIFYELMIEILNFIFII